MRGTHSGVEVCLAETTCPIFYSPFTPFSFPLLAVLGQKAVLGQEAVLGKKTVFIECQKRVNHLTITSLPAAPPLHNLG